jgi:uncharacterized membrane protein
MAISPRRQAFDRAVQNGVWGVLDWCAEHWLALLNTGAFVLFFIPVFVAPAFMAMGWHDAGNAIMMAFSALCHQMPERSFYLFGEQLGLCHRMAALHGFFFLFGMLYITVRRRLGGLPTWLAVVYCLPLVIDGTTQLFGWRESTWELRVATGAFFALSAVWYMYPHLELIMPVVRRSLRPAYI